MTEKETSDRRKRFTESNQYAVYYGHNQVDALSTYDIVIVEPAGQTADTLKQLHESSTLVLAYVSITEVPDYDPLKKYLQSHDYLTVNGRIIENAEYHTQLVTLRSKNWTNLLLHRIGGLLRKSGYDGLFLDTISNVEWPVLPAGVRAEQQAAATELLQRLRAMYPTHILVQNNGLESLCLETAPYIDAFCWENPDFIKPETYAWHEAIRLRLKKLTAQHEIKIMLLLEKGSTTEPGQESARYWAGREKYLLYTSPYRYLEVELLGSTKAEN